MPERFSRIYIGFATGLVVIGLMLGIGAWLFMDTPLPEWLAGASPESFKKLVLSWGEWGVVASILLMVLHSFVPFPAEFVAIANGMCFGLIWGTVITWVGAMLGALMAFALSRRFGRPLVERLVAQKNWHGIDDWIARYGGSGVFLGRFIPVIAFNLINYAAGLTKISYWTFLWTTGLGILPMTTLMVLLGSEMHELSIYSWLMIAAAGLGVWLLVNRIIARRAAFPSPFGLRR